MQGSVLNYNNTSAFKEKSELNKLQVLHVDDDQDFLDLFRITFYKQIDIISLLDVQKAFQLLRSKHFDAVVTDYEMPQMDGLDLLRLLKDEFPDVPVIFYTGQGNEEIAREAFIQGASDYFTKDLTGFAYKEKILNSIKKAAEIRKTKIEKRAGDERYKTLVEGSGQPIIIINKKGVLLFANTTAVEHLSNNLEDITGKSLYNVIPQKSAKRLIQMAEYAIQYKLPAIDEIVLNKDEMEKFYETRVHPLKEFSGAVDSAIVIAYDITDRKVSQQALVQSEEKFRLAFETSPDSININRVRDGLYTQINQGFTDTTGYTKEEVIGKTSYQIDIWHDYNDRNRLIDILKENGYVKNFKAQFRLKNGENRTGLMSARIILLEGEPHILSITRDIEELEQAEAAKKESERKYKDIFYDAPIGIFQSSIQGKMLRVNPALAQMFGYNSPEEFISEVTDVGNTHYYNPLQRKKIIEIIEKKDRLVSFETKLLRKDRSIFYANLHYKAVRDKKGSIYMLEGFVEDITKRKHIEGEHKRNLRLLKLLIENSMDTVWIIDKQGSLTFVTPSITTLLGFSPEEIMQKKLSEVISDDCYQQAKQVFESFMQSDVFNVENAVFIYVDLLRKDGGLVKTEIKINHFIDENGKVSGITGVVREAPAQVFQTS